VARCITWKYRSTQTLVIKKVTPEIISPDKGYHLTIYRLHIENYTDQGCLHVFSMRATYTMNKSKWSTYYKNAKCIFINKCIENLFTIYVDVPCIHTWVHIEQYITMYFCHYLTLLWWLALNGIGQGVNVMRSTHSTFEIVW